MKHNKKICHVTIGHSPTDDRIFYKESKSLVKIYKNFHVIAPDRQQVDSISGITFHLYKEGTYFSNFSKAFQLMKKVDADVYHFHEFEMFPWALLMKLKYKKKIIYDAHETIFWYFIEFSKRPRYITIFPAIIAQVIEWFFCTIADQVITVTPWVAEDLKFICGGKLTILYNYPVVNVFPQNIMTKEKLKNSIILYHGQLTKARNISIIVKAMTVIKKSCPNAKLLLVGNIKPDYKKELETIIHQYNIENNIEFRKRIPYSEIPELISSAAVGISSMSPNNSFKKSIQIKPFEFMIMKVPVIGCRVPSTEKYIEQENSGLLVDNPDEKSLADAIIKILVNYQLAKFMGNNGYDAVIEKYNWEKEESKLYRIYKKVINSK